MRFARTRRRVAVKKPSGSAARSLDPLTIVTFLWSPPKGYRSPYTCEHVNILRRMVRRNYPDPHRFVLITDNAAGLTEPDIEPFELWPDFADLRNPNGTNNPSCYRRLRLFAPQPGAFLGPRFVCLDLDCVITGDMRPIWNRNDDFVIWKAPGGNNNPYCGSMFMLKAGARPHVWTNFDPVKSPILTAQHGLFGSDQAWIAYTLGRDEKTWAKADGVYSYRLQAAQRALPGNARIVFFHGKPDPWDPDPQRKPWVCENYR
jgi:hypothetical protein